VNYFLRGLITEWRRLGLPFAGETVIAAVSGGADSVSLLVGLDELRRMGKLDLRIVAAHFDHKLRPESSGTDLEFVRRLTVKRHIELAAGEWEQHAGGNLEQSARRARYDFLAATAEKLRSGIVLTGHTMNDQAETVLMNLIRGSGPAGLGGMRPLGELEPREAATDSPGAAELPFPAPAITLARPMLKWAKRRDTEDFCREHDIEFCLDPMNEDVTFRRVWIRKVLLPLIEEANPKIVGSLCRTAELMQMGSAAGNGPATAPESAAVDNADGETLSIKHLKTLDQPGRYSAIRAWIGAKRGNLRGLQLKHIESIERLLSSPKSGKYVELPGKARVSRARGALTFEEIEVDN
jgi:tRNA(Ile)-lysidine synthase